MSYYPPDRSQSSSWSARSPGVTHDRVMTLLENLQYDSASGYPKKVGFYGTPREPEATGSRYPPPSIPQGTHHDERYQYVQQLRSIDREDELAPAATGILTAIGGEGGLMMMKIIRNVPISWRGNLVTIPLRIQWEIEALEKTGTLGSAMLHQWGYWVDPATARGSGPLGSRGSGSARGEVYISITKELGVPLREYRPYAEMRSEYERTQFLTRLKWLVMRRIMQYANEDGIFHGGLDLGNIHIIPKSRIIRHHDKAPSFEDTGDIEIRFTDWGWVRKVTERKDILDCSDPWIVPKSMVIPKRKGPLYGKDDEREFTVYLEQYVDAVFDTAWKLKGWDHGGVKDWKHPW